MTNCANCNDNLDYHSETKTEIYLKKLSKRLEGITVRVSPQASQQRKEVDIFE